MEHKTQSPASPEIDRLAKVYIEPTNRCNLDCRTCMRHGWEEPLGFMEFGLFEKIMADLRSFPERPGIFFGGFGEPLGHARIADMVAAAKPGGSEVELISNGILLDEAMADRLVAAGLDRLWVSIDGASPRELCRCPPGRPPATDHRQPGTPEGEEAASPSWASPSWP